MRILKKTLVIFIILIVIAAALVGVLFGCFNNFKFMTISQKKVKQFAESYDGSVRFIAHRGLSGEGEGYGYQNTKEAFELAADDPYVWGIETDVWMTSDKEIICMHDRDAIKGVENVRDITLEEALATPLKDNKEKYACSFDEYLSICKNGDKTAVIELKDEYMTEEDIDVMLQKVAASEAKVMYISFYFKKLKYIRSLDADVKLQLLAFLEHPRDMSYIAKTKEEKLQKAIDERMDFSCFYWFLTEKTVKKFHDAGLEVGVWTVNTPKETILCVSKLGADFVTTDYRMKQLVDDYMTKELSMQAPAVA